MPVLNDNPVQDSEDKTLALSPEELTIQACQHMSDLSLAWTRLNDPVAQDSAHKALPLKTRSALKISGPSEINPSIIDSNSLSCFWFMGFLLI